MTTTAEPVALRDAPVLDIDPYAIEVLLDPYPFHEALREAGPVAYIAPHGIYAVGRHAEAKTVLADHARFTNAGGIGIQDIRKPGEFRIPSRLLEADPPDHTKIRSVVTRLLSPLVIRRWKEGFERKAESLVERLLDQREFDGVEDCAERFVLEAFPAAVGVRLPRTETLAIGEMRFNQSGPRNALYERAMQAAQPYLAWFEQSVSRQGVIPDSIAELLFRAEDAGELDEGIASNVVRSFVGGGTDSTIAGIGFTLHQLARNPAQWERVRNEPAKVKAAFEEGIRHETPFQVTYRTTRGETELSGVRLAPDTKIGVFMGAANRDPRQFPEPERFDVDRPALAGSHVALGNGIHACIGQMLARQESEALIGALSRHVARMELTAPASYRPINQMRTLDRLPMRIVPA
ncbi:cytochrome P450 [Variovorax sp.]|jgi:4-methoxybenzoate monooxygenase (O-demethylating)|uniref:cytochrome P450 n=1 Tax=Variovorax sp. TaxID=1871043 RepID=UPI0011FF3EB4|nr:cytochrome P450 [Variovorax sp.]TAJ58887.1 MAG: cytochrome P450 [Variovorax sp.]